MATLIRRHPLLACVRRSLSWGGFVLVVGPGSLVNTNWQAEGRFLSAVMVMLAGPSIAGLLLTGLVDGRAGYRDLFLRLCKWRVGIRWYALAILPAPIVSAGILFALSMTSPLLTADNKAAVVLGGLGAAATTVLEEIGWTGFVVPRLRRRHGVPMTGLIVGALWGLWHFLQQVFVSGTYAGGIPLLAFLMLSVFAAVANLTAYRVLMVWVYDRTGSLLVTTLMHGTLTASSIFWFTPIATGAPFLANVWLVAVVMWLLVGVVAVADGWLRLDHTAPFRGPDGNVLPNSVAEVRRARRVDQWVMIRGEHVANPLLIVLRRSGRARWASSAVTTRCSSDTSPSSSLGSARHRKIVRSKYSNILDDARPVRRRSRRARRHGAPALRKRVAIWATPGARARRDLRRAISGKSLYVGAAQIGDAAAGESCHTLRTRRSGAPGTTKALKSCARSVLRRIRQACSSTHGRQSNGWADAPGNPLEGWTGALRSAGIVVFDLQTSCGAPGLRSTPWAEVSNTDLLSLPALKMPGHLRWTPDLGAARDELLRRACRAVEETVWLVLRARSIHRRARNSTDDVELVRPSLRCPPPGTPARFLSALEHRAEAKLRNRVAPWRERQ